MRAQKIELFEQRFGDAPVQVEGRIKIPYSWSVGQTPHSFLVSLRERQAIQGLKCENCAKTSVPPMTARCPFCFGEARWVDVGNSGTVRALTRFNGKIFALIQLVGADTCLLHVLTDSDIQVGDRVRAVFAELRTGSILDIAGFSKRGLK